jgi:hypothetical protein
MSRKQISELDWDTDKDLVSWVVEEVFVKNLVEIETAKKE